MILLLDERFRNREYRELFPREWEDCRIVQRSSLPEVIHSFWERVDCESGSKAGQQEMKSRYSAERYVCSARFRYSLGEQPICCRKILEK